MKHFLHQFRKDWAEFRWWIIGLWGVCAAYGAFIWRTLSSASSMGTFYDAPPWWCLLADLTPMVCSAVLSVRVLLADHALAPNTFWRSRPLTRTSVGCAKAIFLTSATVVPLSLTAMIHPIWFDMPIQEIAIVCGWRFLGLTSLGWLLYWGVGFFDRPAFCLGGFLVLLLLFQFHLVKFCTLLPETIGALIRWALSRVGWHGINLSSFSDEIGVTCWLGWGFLSVFLVAMCHYCAGRMRTSIGWALLIWMLPGALGISSARNSAIANAPHPRATGIPDFKVRVTDATITPSMSRINRTTRELAPSLSLGLHFEPPPTDYYLYPISLGASPHLDKRGQEMDIIFNGDDLSSDAIRYSLWLEKVLRKYSMGSPEPTRIRYSSQHSRLEFKNPDAFDLSDPAGISLKFDDQMEVKVGKLREIHRARVASTGVTRWKGYAWATESTELEKRIEVRNYRSGPAWEVRSSIAFLSELQRGFQIVRKPGILLAKLWDHKRQAVATNPESGSRVANDFWSLRFRSSVSPGTATPASSELPIDWNDIDLVLYEPTALGTASIPLSIESGLEVTSQMEQTK